MMRTLTIVVFGMLLAGCGAGNPGLGMQPIVTGIHGSSMADVEVEADSSSIRIEAASLDARGLFLEARFPDELDVTVEQWQGDSGTVHLVADTASGAQIGLVPTKKYSGGPVSLLLSLGPAKSASVPPVGERNIVSDLTVSDNGDGTVRLSWTEFNNGDYDFNGQVNISDLTPLAQHMDESYDRAAQDAHLRTEYWVDGDGNGVVNISDVTPIGANLDATIAGYNVRHGGEVISGAKDGDPTILRSSSTDRDDLPPTYTFDAAGLTTDGWSVTSVDQFGVEGADSDGGLGPVNLLSNVAISGLELFDLDGSNPGAFDIGKITSRVILPIEEVDSIEAGDTVPTVSGGFASSGLPRNKVLFLQFRYLPTIELATGAPKGGSGLRGASAVDDADFVNTSIPVRIPDTEDPVQVDAVIDLGTPNPDGGVFLDMTVTTTTPDPLGGPAIVVTKHLQLDPANGSVSADTDGNGSFDDEPSLTDSDGDCVSDVRREQELDDDDYDDDDDERDEIEIEAVISAGGIDFVNGTIKLEQIVVEAGEVTFEGGIGEILFSELTRFEEKIKTSGDDIEQDIDPLTLMPGDTVEIDLYELVDGSGLLQPVFWAEKVDRRIDEDDDD